MKSKLKNGLEWDAILYRDMYCYLINNPKLVKWAKRQINKRIRRKNKINYLNIND